MENASRALLMAGGILLGILILSLMVTLFASSSSLSKTYDESKQSEAIQKFNANFTQYLGEDRLTIHEVVTICNFADINDVSVTTGRKTNEDIKSIVASYSNDESTIQKYTLKINSYSEEGYINSISFE